MWLESWTFAMTVQTNLITGWCTRKHRKIKQQQTQKQACTGLGLILLPEMDVQTFTNTFHCTFPVLFGASVYVCDTQVTKQIQTCQ